MFQADKSNLDSHHQHGQQLQVCTVYIPQPRSPYPSPLPTSKSVEEAVKNSRPWSCQTQQSMKRSKLLVSKVQSGLADTYHSTYDHLDKPINGWSAAAPCVKWVTLCDGGASVMLTVARCRPWFHTAGCVASCRKQAQSQRKD